MNYPKKVENRISDYLVEVRMHLSALSEGEIEEILSSIRSHIDTKLAEGSVGEPSLESIEEVLSGMDPPESYGESAATLVTEAPSERRLSRFAMIGAILMPFGVIAAIMLFTVSSVSVGTAREVSTSPTGLQWLARFTILPLGILAPFACTILGLMAISEIRGSQGKVSGLPLALLVTIFYPLLLLDAALFSLFFNLIPAGDYWNLLALATVLLLLVLDFFLVRWVWRAASRGR